MRGRYIAERATSPDRSSPAYVIVDQTYRFHIEACTYLAHLRAAGRSPNTERVYASRLACFLNFCDESRIDWQSITFDDLSRFLNSLAGKPVDSTRHGKENSRFRSNATANAIMTATCEFLRFGASHGWVKQELVRSLTRPKYLRHHALGQDWGEDEQYRTVSERLLKLPESGVAIRSIPRDEVQELVHGTTNSRDKFLIVVLYETGMRIGEALGLRRSDVHFLSSSSRLGCSVAGPHVHVRRRQNSNGAIAKSRFPRVVPVTSETVYLYADYQRDRDKVQNTGETDFVFVNLFRPPLGAPMKYSNAKKMFDRLSANAEVPATPHTLRHSAASRWVDNGTPRDVVQALLGHVSSTSMEVYLHPSNEAIRAAVERHGGSK